jgi:putative endonuclease
MSVTDYSLYILRCADRSLYTGIAIDVDKRLQQHRSGIKGAKYLRGRTPFELVFEQLAGDRSNALRLEHRVKQLNKTRKEALISGEFPLLGLLPENGTKSGQASGGS